MMRKSAFLIIMGIFWVSVAQSFPPSAQIYTFPLPAPLTATLEVAPVFLQGQSLEMLYHRTDDHANVLLVHDLGDWNLYYSTDMARTWTQVPNSRSTWKSGFVTEKGDFLVWDGKQVHLLTRDGKSELVQPDAPVIWHGTQGIGEVGPTIVYAEYTTEDQKQVRVFRSTDYGHTWKTVFQQSTRNSDNDQVRHFHLCQPDPYHKGNWYLASGDYAKECHIWLSKDDGLTWKEVTDPRVQGTNGQSVQRFTSIVFTKDALVVGHRRPHAQEARRPRQSDAGRTPARRGHR